MGRRAVRAGGGSGVGCSHRQPQPAAAEAAVAAAGGGQACRWEATFLVLFATFLRGAMFSSTAFM